MSAGNAKRLVVAKNFIKTFEIYRSISPDEYAVSGPFVWLSLFINPTMVGDCLTNLLTEYLVHGRTLAADGQKEPLDGAKEPDQLGVHGPYPIVFPVRVFDKPLQVRPQPVHVLLLFRRPRLVDGPLFDHPVL